METPDKVKDGQFQSMKNESERSNNFHMLPHNIEEITTSHGTPILSFTVPASTFASGIRHVLPQIPQRDSNPRTAISKNQHRDPNVSNFKSDGFIEFSDGEGWKQGNESSDSFHDDNSIETHPWSDENTVKFEKQLFINNNMSGGIVIHNDTPHILQIMKNEDISNLNMDLTINLTKDIDKSIAHENMTKDSRLQNIGQITNINKDVGDDNLRQHLEYNNSSPTHSDIDFEHLHNSNIFFKNTTSNFEQRFLDIQNPASRSIELQYSQCENQISSFKNNLSDQQWDTLPNSVQYRNINPQSFSSENFDHPFITPNTERFAASDGALKMMEQRYDTYRVDTDLYGFPPNKTIDFLRQYPSQQDQFYDKRHSDDYKLYTMSEHSRIASVVPMPATLPEKIVHVEEEEEDGFIKNSGDYVIQELSSPNPMKFVHPLINKFAETDKRMVRLPIMQESFSNFEVSYGNQSFLPSNQFIIQNNQGSKPKTGRAKTNAELKKQLLEKKAGQQAGRNYGEGSSQASSPSPSPISLSSRTSSPNLIIVEERGITDASGLKWVVGDMLWSKVDGHPWWPTVISNDPFTGEYLKLSTGGQKNDYHVRFLGDSEERGWVPEISCMPYLGRESFDQFCTQMLADNKKDRKNFQVPSSRRKQWEIAVKQAERAYRMPRNERIELYAVHTSFAKEIGLPKIKRKYVKSGLFSSDKNNPDAKKARLNVIFSDLNTNMPINMQLNFSVNNNLHVNTTLPDSPLNAPNLETLNKISDSMPNSNMQSKNISKQEQAQFAVFCRIKESNILAENPNISDVAKESLLWQQWILLDADTKSRFIPMGSDFTNLNRLIVDRGQTKQVESLAPVRKVGRPSLLKNTKQPASPSIKKTVKLDKKDAISCLPVKKRKSEILDKETLNNEAAILEEVCFLCWKPDFKLIQCEGPCRILMHNSCMLRSFEKNKLKINDEKILCATCRMDTHKCATCGDTAKNDSELKLCHIVDCGRFYHQKCVDSKFCKNDALICPLHSCVSCRAREKLTESDYVLADTEDLDFYECIRCSNAYHMTGMCLAPGSTYLAGNFILCPRHFEPNKSNTLHAKYSANWCFVCEKGGGLVFCESCPAAYHGLCLNLKEISVKYKCANCVKGFYPLPGDIVWVKFGNYRWWPAQIYWPYEVPSNIAELPHITGEFPICFYGSRDFLWINRLRVFPFQLGDKCHREANLKSGGKIFDKAIREATAAYKALFPDENHEEADPRLNDEKMEDPKNVENCYKNKESNLIPINEEKSRKSQFKRKSFEDTWKRRRKLVIAKNVLKNISAVNFWVAGEYENICFQCNQPAIHKIINNFKDYNDYAVLNEFSTQVSSEVKEDGLDCKLKNKSSTGFDTTNNIMETMSSSTIGTLPHNDIKDEININTLTNDNKLKGIKSSINEYQNILNNDDRNKKYDMIEINDDVKLVQDKIFINNSKTCLNNISDSIRSVQNHSNLSRKTNTFDNICLPQENSTRIPFVNNDLDEGEIIDDDYRDSKDNDVNSVMATGHKNNSYISFGLKNYTTSNIISDNVIKDMSNKATKLADESESSYKQKISENVDNDLCKDKKNDNFIFSKDENIDSYKEDSCVVDRLRVLLCDKLRCSKVYHYSCLRIAHLPHGPWTCPWHMCNVCGRAAITQCSKCPNAFCTEHCIDKIGYDQSDFKVICWNHKGVTLPNHGESIEISTVKGNVTLLNEKNKNKKILSDIKVRKKRHRINSVSIRPKRFSLNKYDILNTNDMQMESSIKVRDTDKRFVGKDKSHNSNSFNVKKINKVLKNSIEKDIDEKHNSFNLEITNRRVKKIKTIKKMKELKKIKRSRLPETYKLFKQGPNFQPKSLIRNIIETKQDNNCDAQITLPTNKIKNKLDSVLKSKDSAVRLKITDNLKNDISSSKIISCKDNLNKNLGKIIDRNSSFAGDSDSTEEDCLENIRTTFVDNTSLRHDSLNTYSINNRSLDFKDGKLMKEGLDFIDSRKILKDSSELKDNVNKSPMFGNSDDEFPELVIDVPN